MTSLFKDAKSLLRRLEQDPLDVHSYSAAEESCAPEAVTLLGTAIRRAMGGSMLIDRSNGRISFHTGGRLNRMPIHLVEEQLRGLTSTLWQRLQTTDNGDYSIDVPRENWVKNTMAPYFRYEVDGKQLEASQFANLHAKARQSYQEAETAYLRLNNIASQPPVAVVIPAHELAPLLEKIGGSQSKARGR